MYSSRGWPGASALKHSWADWDTNEGVCLSQVTTDSRANHSYVLPVFQLHGASTTVTLDLSRSPGNCQPRVVAVISDMEQSLPVTLMRTKAKDHTGENFSPLEMARAKIYARLRKPHQSKGRACFLSIVTSQWRTHPTKVKTKREKKMCQVTGKGRFSLQRDDAVAPSGIPVLGLLVALHCRKAMFLSLYETRSHLLTWAW